VQYLKSSKPPRLKTWHKNIYKKSANENNKKLRKYGMWKNPNQFWTWQVATLGLLKKMAHIYFHQIKSKNLTFNLCSDTWQKWGCRKRRSQFIKTIFNFINQKVMWKGHMVELVLLKNSAQIFLKKLKTLKINIWHLNLPHGRICVIEIDGSDLLLVGF